MSNFEWQESETVQLISPEQLKQWASQQDAPLVIDVRNEDEHKTDQLLLQFVIDESLKNIPITEFGSHINQLDPDQPLVLVCQVGQKSFNAASLLIQADFSCVYSLHGGMEALKRSAKE